MARTDLLVWIDPEMTGLDPAKERIIEIATIITDGDLEVIAEGPDLAINQPESLLDAMDEWNTTHHTESGLIEQVRNSPLDTAAAEQQTLDFIKEHCAERSAPLCGNSIWQDRRFLHRYMPTLAEYLHYRSIDVSSFKELVKRWKPEATAPRKQASHRALDDIRESIAELRHYKQHLFR